LQEVESRAQEVQKIQEKLEKSEVEASKLQQKVAATEGRNTELVDGLQVRLSPHLSLACFATMKA